MSISLKNIAISTFYFVFSFYLKILPHKKGVFLSPFLCSTAKIWHLKLKIDIDAVVKKHRAFYCD